MKHLMMSKKFWLMQVPQIGKFLWKTITLLSYVAKWVLVTLFSYVGKWGRSLLYYLHRVPWILSWVCSSSVSEASENIDSSDELKSSELKSLKIIFAIFSLSLFELVQMCDIERISVFLNFSFIRQRSLLQIKQLVEVVQSTGTPLYADRAG